MPARDSAFMSDAGAADAFDEPSEPGGPDVATPSADGGRGDVGGWPDLAAPHPPAADTALAPDVGPPSADSARTDAASEAGPQLDAAEVESPIAVPGSGAPLARLCGGALELDEVALYQGVKVTLAKDGGAAPRAVDVVERRPALLRAFVKTGGGWTTGEAIAKLIVRGAGASKIYERRLAISRDSTDGALASTFNFELPGADLPSDAAYALELASPACPGASARYPANGEALLRPVRAGVLKVRLVPVRFDTDGSGRLPDLSAAQLALYRDLLLATFPVRDVEIGVRDAVGTPLAVTASSGWLELLESLRALRKSDGPPSDLYYYGIVNPAETGGVYCGSSCIAGIAYQNSAADAATRVGVGVGFAGLRAAEAMAHELGHEHGRQHSPCGSVKDADSSYPHAGGGIGSWGYDARTKQLVDPSRGKDMMGYCEPRWISDFTYRAFLERSRMVNGEAVALAIRPSAATETLHRWRTLLVEAGIARWGLGHEGRAFGTRRAAEALDAQGAVVARIDAYATAVGDADASTWLVPQPEPSWHAIRVEGAPALPFAAPSAVTPLRP